MVKRTEQAATFLKPLSSPAPGKGPGRTFGYRELPAGSFQKMPGMPTKATPHIALHPAPQILVGAASVAAFTGTRVDTGAVQVSTPMPLVTIAELDVRWRELIILVYALSLSDLSVSINARGEVQVQGQSGKQDVEEAIQLLSPATVLILAHVSTTHMLLTIS